MATRVVLKKSSVVGKTPLPADLQYGEFAINYADELLYFKNTSNVIKSFSTSGGSASSGGAVTGSFSTHTGDGSTTVYAIGSTPVSINNVYVTINGVSQTPTTDFTILSSNLTFTSAPLSGDDIVIRDNRSVSSTVALTTNTRYHYIFTASTTVITGVDDNGLTLNVDEQNVFLFLNGSKLIHGDDYTVATGGATITLVAAAAIGDELEIQSLGSASVLKIEDAEELGLLHSIQATFRSITNSTAQVTLCEVPIASFQSCRYTISVKTTAGIHMTEIMSIHDDVDVYTNEFGEIISGSSLGTFTADINSSMMRLLVTPASGVSTTFTVHRTGIET
jgi:hypothetical protein